MIFNNIKSLFVILLVTFNLILMSSCNNTNNLPNSQEVTDTACGYWHSVALMDNGTVRAWGANWYGQLGSGDFSESPVPRVINNLTNIKAIACGEAHSLALKNDGTVWAWGANFYGQLGDGTTETKPVPTKVKGLSNIIDISCGDSHCLALKKDGSVWAWGYNYKGQLGNGKTTNSMLPIEVINLNDVVAISASLSDSYAIRRDGSVWAWGSNGNGQLGICIKSDVYTPVKVENLEEIKFIAPGGTHCLALKDDGSVWAWGSNGNGQLGNSTTKRSEQPIKISGLKNVKAIACGDTSSMCLKQDGTVWSWGGGMPLGNASTKATPLPSKIEKLSNIKKICANYNHCMVIKNDGSIWAWGKNWKGQVGISSMQDVLEPIQLNFSESEIKYTKFEENQKEIYNPNLLNKVEVDTDEHAFLNNVLQNQTFLQEWALYNNGQTISSEKCKKGVDINIIRAWNLTLGSKNIVVGVLDTGIDINHSDLINNIYSNRNEFLDNMQDNDANGYINDINGWDFVNNDNLVYDSPKQDSHGTMVAGIIAANSDKVGLVGVAPRVRILPLKFMNGNEGSISDIIKAIEYAKDRGIKIINCSWGWTDIKYNKILENIIKDSDITFICSAGNKRSNEPTKIFYPACFDLPNIISVASINYEGILDPSSNFGEYIDVAAPGVGILTTTPENSYAFFNGTSAATPFVSGIAALLKSYTQELSYVEISEYIKKSTTFSKELEGKVRSNGMVNALNALKMIDKD